MSQDELITVKKTGHPTLRITRRSLPEHVKLGWAHVEDEKPAPKAETKPELPRGK